MKNIKNILSEYEYIIIIAIIILVSLAVILIPNLDSSFIKTGNLYITEVVANNTYTYLDDDEEYSDYIEIYNGYNHEIDLSGYHLSDSEYETNKWTFPNIKIGKKEYLIIFASGKDKCDLENKICHTNFKLSKKGEVLTLSDEHGNIINKFTYPNLKNDVAFGYARLKYMMLSKPTPMSKNSDKYKYTKLSNKDVFLNEYMIHNQRNSYDSLGNYNDFIELYNSSNKDIELNNIYLSDDLKELDKYKLPNVTINKNDYLLIYMGEKSSVVNNQITAGFKLSREDKYMILSNGKKVIEKIELVLLSDNISYGRKDDKWYYFTKPTPGKENNTLAHESLGGTNERS